ncbi:MAG: hypothetical protein Kow00108_17050 [Calditrichia bacterium]
MKIWQGYGSEHSQDLSMMAKYKTETEAKYMMEYIEKILEKLKKKKRDKPNGPIRDGIFNTEIERFLQRNVENFTVYRTDKTITVFDMDNRVIIFFLNIFLNVHPPHSDGPKITIYSMHGWDPYYFDEDGNLRKYTLDGLPIEPDDDEEE